MSSIGESMVHPAVPRAIGALFLSAFVLFGAGSALGSSPWGLVLIVVNSVAVATIGVLFHDLVHANHPRAASAYLIARGSEAVVLAIGGLLVRLKALPVGSGVALDVAMVGLGVGSVPLFHMLGAERRLPRLLALWGVVGYIALTVGSLLDLGGWPVALWFSVPGGIFELVFGTWLLTGGLHPRKEGA